MLATKMPYASSASRKHFRFWLAAPAFLLALAACDRTGGTGPGGVSEGEAQALEDAAEMLDERRLPEEALPQIEGPPIEGSESTEVTGDNAE
ncbi:MAG: hypothetical protein AAGK01_02180 [Pseudomonadota bacterium]